MATILPDYKKPPVIEVVCGITFEKIKHFKATHLGLFWQELRHEYPNCQHAHPLGFPGGPDQSIDMLPLPRMWFINKDTSGLIQLQNDRFLYNWRKIRDNNPYPRYCEIIKVFKANLEIFNSFLEKEELEPIKPIELELSYVNHIVKGEGWESFAKIHDVLPDLCWRSNTERFLPEPDSMGWQCTFPLPENNGSLNINLKHANRKSDNHPLLSLENSARWNGGDKPLNKIWDWFDLAHEWIVRGFADITNMEFQKTFLEKLDEK